MMKVSVREDFTHRECGYISNRTSLSNRGPEVGYCFEPTETDMPTASVATFLRYYIGCK